MKTLDEKADAYVNRVSLDPKTYKGDVQTAYVFGAKEERDEWEIKSLEFLSSICNQFPIKDSVQIESIFRLKMGFGPHIHGSDSPMMQEIM